MVTEKKAMDLFYLMKGKGNKPSKSSLKDAVYYQHQLGERYQYIISNSASEGDIIEFAQNKPKKIARKIYKRLGLVESPAGFSWKTTLTFLLKNRVHELFFL